jgi:hypothetical protein
MGDAPNARGRRLLEQGSQGSCQTLSERYRLNIVLILLEKSSKPDDGEELRHTGRLHTNGDIRSENMQNFSPPPCSADASPGFVGWAKERSDVPTIYRRAR